MRVRKTPPKEFTIDRAEWVNGGRDPDKSGESGLLNPEDNACCLGFYANACGVPWDKLFNMDTPRELLTTRRITLPLMLDEHKCTSYFARLCMDINDESSLCAKERERQLRAAFKEHDVKIKFVGRYPKDAS